MGTRIANPYGYERAFKHSLDATNGDWLFDSTVTPAESRKSSGTRMVLDPSTARGVNGGANWGEWAPVPRSGPGEANASRLELPGLASGSTNLVEVRGSAIRGWATPVSATRRASRRCRGRGRHRFRLKNLSIAPYGRRLPPQ